MINFRKALLVSLIAGLTACSSGGSDGDDPRVPDPANGGDQAPVSLDFSSTPEGNPVEEERWQYQIETNLADSDFLTFSLVSGPDSMTISEDGLVQWTPDDEDGTEVQVTVRVVYNDGTNTADAQQTFELSVTPVNDKPEITSVAPATAVAGSQFQYQLVVNDPDDLNDGEGLTYTVELPYVDVSPEDYGVTISSTGLLQWNVPAEPSAFLYYPGLRITVRVTDGEEDWGDNPLLAAPSQRWNLKVVDENTPPVITSAAIETATEDLLYSYQLVAEDTAGVDASGDPIADELTYSLVSGPDEMTISGSGLVEWTPAENGSEAYSVDVIVQVKDGGENEVEPVQQPYTIQVTPVNDAPTVTNSLPVLAELGEEYSVQLNVLDSDDDNDGITFTLTEAPEEMGLTAEGLVTWTPEELGNFDVSVEVADGGEDGASPVVVSATIEVTDSNTAPVIDQPAVAISTDEDVAGTAILTATDADGDVLTWSISSAATEGSAEVVDGVVTYTPAQDFNGTDAFTVEVTDGIGVDPIVVGVTVNAVNDAPVIEQGETVGLSTDQDTEGTVTLSASDVEGDSLIWSVLTGATNGTASVAGGVVTYVPDAGFTGSDSIVIEVSDGTDTDTITVNVEVSDTADAPVIDQETASITTDEDTEGATTLTATDADGDALVWSVSAQPANQPANGVAAVSGGSVTYTPDADFAGGDSFTVVVSDGALTDTLVVSVTVNPVNDAPVFDQVSAAISTDEDTQGTVSLSATDVEGDTLTWSISTQAGNGVASVVDGEVTYQPSAEFSGTDSFVVSVSDGTDSATLPVSVTVAAVNDAPVIFGTAPTSATEGVEYRYAVDADDIDGPTLSYSLATAPAGMQISESGVITWTPANGDTGGDVVVVVSDGVLTAEQAYPLTVSATNDAPEITSTAPTSATEDQEYTYVPAANDPDGDTLSWELTQSPASMTINSATGAIAWTPANGVASADITLVVSDGSLTDPQTFTITVDPVNDAPVISQGDSAALTTDEDVESNLTLAATDVDSTELTWSVSGVATNGSADVTDGVVSYTPAADFNGSDSFVVTVSDGELTDSITISITVDAVNDAPVITSPAPTGAIEGAELSYQILANDVDGDSLTYTLISGPTGMTMSATGLVTWTPENGAADASAEFSVSDGTETVTQTASIQVTATNEAPVITEGESTTLTTDEDTAGSVTLNATDADGNPITWSISAGAANGTASVSGMGESQTVTYTPDADFNGSDSFTVQISDGNGSDSTDSIIVNVTVAAVNDVPEITEGETAELTTDEDTEGSLALTASDVDGDSLSWSVSSAPANGTASVVDGAVTYTPDAAFNGSDSFVVAVSDGTDTDTIAVSVSVSPVNDAPVIDQETVSIATDEDTEGTTTLTATDVDGDTLAWTIVAAAANGTASVAGGNVSYTPAGDFNGSDSFTVEVSDGELSDTIVVDVSVNAINDEPVIAEGETATLTTAEDTEGTLTLSASDVDGDSLSWAISSAATNGTAAVVDGAITYQPDAGYNGADSFTVEVSDGNAVDTIVVNVSVSSENDAPVIDQETASVSTSEDSAGSVSLSATDPDGDALSWTVIVAPENGSASVVAGEVTYTPDADYNGSDSLTVQVSDGTLTDSIEVSVAVAAVNDAPLFANAASTSAVEGSEYQYKAVINDVDDANNGSDLTFTLTNAPAGMAVSGTGLVTWTPANGVTSAEVVLEVADGGEDAAATATQSWTITVVATNDAPVITSSAPLTAEEGALYQYDVQVEDPDDANNGMDLTFTLVNAPEGMTVSPMGSIQWTPVDGVTSADVLLRVADGGESGADPASQSWTITVTPVNDAPVIDQGESAALTTTEDTTGTLDLTATDIDSETISWSVTSPASEGAASVVDGSVSYDPADDFNGTDSFTVEVSDGELSDTIVVNVTVEAANDAPVFTSTAETEATEDEAYSYTAEASDADGDALTFSLQTKPAGMTIDSETGVITWTPANGVETGAVTVAVTDGTATVTQSFVITVTAVNDAPVITSTAPTSATEDLLYTYAVAANDVDGDALTYSLTTAPTGMTISAAGVISWTPENGVEGADVVVDVSDGTESDTQSFTIVVNATNDAPAIDQGESTALTTDEDASQTLALTATDIDGDSLSWSVTSGAANGEASVDSAGLVTYVPAADFNGSDTFTVQVSDSELTDSILINVSVSPVNDAPVVAEGDAVSITTAEDTQKSLTLNATDVDGDSLSWSIAAPAASGSAAVSAGVVSYTPAAGYNGSDSFTVAVTDGTDTVTVQVNVTVTAENDAPVIDQASASISTSEDTQGSVTLSASDPEGTSLNWTISSAAANGVANVGASGVVTYDPALNFNGSDSFTVMVSDGDLNDTRVVNVVVSAVNDAPEITEGETASLSTDEDNMGSVTLNATDVEGDTINWSIQSQASDGTAVVSGTGTSQTVNYTPAADFHGSDSFVVRVSDGDLTDTITVNVTVNAANDAPVITSTEVTTATEGEAYLYTVAANDVDGDALSYSLTEAPEGMTISGSTINWTPENGVETANVTVTVADVTAEATQNFTITVTPVNDAPSITSAAVTTATEGEAYSYTVVAEDVDSTELAYSLASAPEGMTISGATISWTPANGVESANVTVEVSDGSLSDSQSFTITVGATNDAPEIDQGAVTALTTDEDTSATLNLTATDVDSESLTWRISNASENGSASVDASGVVSYEPAADFNGSDSFEVEVSDSELTDTIVVDVTVTPVADAPVIAEGETAARTTNEDQPLTFALNASDVDSATINWSISSVASNGSATVSGTGTTQSVNYVPNQNFNGTDSFVVQVSDGSLNSTIAVTVTVNAVNDLPEITSVAPVVATEGELYTYLPSATDVEGDALTWNVGTAPASMTVNSATGELNWTPAEGVTSADVTLLVNDGGANVTQAFTITVTAVNNAPVITQGESTSVTMSEDGAPTPFTLVLNATDSDHAGSELSWSVSSAATNGTATVSGTGLSKTVNYAPGTGFSGADSFTVQVTDGELTDSIVVNVTVQAVNAAPVIDQGDTTTMTLDEDGTQTLSLSATDSDGDSLIWSVTSSASNGGVNVDSNGLVTYVPVADFYGNDIFTVQVSDSELTDSITVSVTVNSVNDAPIIAEGASVTLEVNEDSSDSVTFTASDADGDPLTWSISSGAVEGIVTQTGSEFSYAPAADFNGSDSFVVQVSDGTATGISTVNVTVIAVNDAPVVTSSPVTTANEYQVYAYDVAASDAEDDAVSYSLTNPPTGMVISSAGEIRWIPESAGTYSVVVNATDGSDAGTQSFDITVNAEPAVAGRAVKGVLANAPVEAAVYAGLDTEGEHSWNVIGTTTTDANGYFGFNLGTQSAPVRVRVTTDAETTMVCDTPSGCLVSPPANFGESGTPAAGMILDTIVSGADFGGPVAVTPMTHMAATWLQAFPQALDDNNVLLAHKRLAVLFGFTDDSYVSQRMPDLTDAFERNFALSSDEQALRHAIFSASLQETAIVASLPIDSLAENIGLIFGLLGGQMPLKSGELDVSTLGLTDPDTEEPITTISYTGFDTFVASAETVGQFINDGSLDTMIAGFGSLVTDWSPELADPSICLVTDNPELDRTECRNVTTIGETTGYDAANFARALAPIDVAGGYLDDAQAAELANGSTVNRDLGWLYVDEAAQNETAEMLGGLAEVLGYGLQTALCVPENNNSLFGTPCQIEPSAGYEAISTSVSSCQGYDGDDSCSLRVTGTVNGQTYNLRSRVEDVRAMLGGKRRIGLFQTNYDFNAGPLPMCFTGTISNSVATMNLNNFCLVLNVSDSRSDLLAPFEDLNAVAYIDIGNEGSAAYNAMQDLLAEVVLEIAATGGLSLASTDSNIGTYSMSNIDMSFVFDRESLVNLNKGTPVFDFEVASFSRTNPWGETLNSVSGYPMFKLQVDDTTILTGRNVKDNVGVPPTLSVTNAIVEGLGPVVDIAKEYALSMIDTTVAAPELTPEQWDAIIAEVEANLAYNGTINTTIQDPLVGDRTYIATLTPEGNVFISQENSTANAMQLYLSGATGYIYADETLVATAHLGNSQDGMLLSFVDGGQRRYTNANPNLSGQLNSFLEFLQVLVPPAEETAP